MVRSVGNPNSSLGYALNGFHGQKVLFPERDYESEHVFSVIEFSWKEVRSRIPEKQKANPHWKKRPASESNLSGAPAPDQRSCAPNYALVEVDKRRSYNVWYRSLAVISGSRAAGTAAWPAAQGHASRGRAFFATV
jgi:hypothetical protein